MRLWWISFVCPDHPEGDRFLGACVVHAAGTREALVAAYNAGCSPGGEAGITELPADYGGHYPEYVLLSKDEVDKIHAEVAS